MNRLIEALEELIVDEAKIPYDQNSKSITLVEMDNLEEKGLKELTISHITEYYYCFKLDDYRFKFLGKLINDGKIKQAVDAVLFCRVFKKNFIFLIEMKSKNASGIKSKIKSSKAFLSFLQTAIEQFYHFEGWSDFEIWSILFDRKAIKGFPVEIRNPNTETFYHQGFSKIRGNGTSIRLFSKNFGDY